MRVRVHSFFSTKHAFFGGCDGAVVPRWGQRSGGERVCVWVGGGGGRGRGRRHHISSRIVDGC